MKDHRDTHAQAEKTKENVEEEEEKKEKSTNTDVLQQEEEKRETIPPGAAIHWLGRKSAAGTGKIRPTNLAAGGAKNPWYCRRC